MKFILPIVFIASFARLVCANESSSAVLDEINFARTNPRGYAQALIAHAATSRADTADPRAFAEAISFLQRATPLPPLSAAQGLVSSAREHVVDQGAHGTFGHNGTDHSSPWKRMAEFGRYSGLRGENISYGYSSARGIVAQLIIDAGVPGRGHRKNIFNPGYEIAGASCGSHARFGSMCVIDFAGGAEDSGYASGAVNMALLGSGRVGTSM